MTLIIELLLIAILVIILVTLKMDEDKRRGRESNLVRLKTYWNGVDRRRVIRYNATLDVNYNINKAVRNTVSKDISTRGIGLILDEKFPRRTVLNLEIKAGESNDTIKAKALVVWSKESLEDEKNDARRLFHTGLKFLSFIEPSHEKRLFDYINRLDEQTTGA